MDDRYFVILGSVTGHCCFEASVLDRTQPLEIPQRPENERFFVVAECHNPEDAYKICAAMNRAEEEK